MFLTKFNLRRILLVCFLSCCAISANATTHLVTNTNDSGAGSLRQVLFDTTLAANQTVINYIEFDAAVFNTAQTITLSSFIQVSHSTGIVVNGTGKNLLTITGGSANTTFEIMNGNFTLNNLAFRNFAGIRGAGSLTLNEVLFDAVSNGNNGIIFLNGANSVNINNTEIINSPLTTNYAVQLSNITGTVNINNSTIADNLCGGFLTSGGAGGRVVNIVNSTISNNRNVGVFFGGLNGAVFNIINSTITRNSSSTGGSGVRHDAPFIPATVNLRNTIIADNINTTTSTNSDVSGIFFSQGNNLIRTTAGATINGNTASNITGVSPMLAATLDFNGGTTRNYALLAGSPAIDAGNNCVVTDTCFAAFQMDFLAPLLTDQRGANRLTGSNVDIGSFEYIAPSAAEVSIGGRILDNNGNAIARVRVSLTKSNGECLTVTTNSFGYYKFESIEVGQIYILQATSRKLQFQHNPRVLQVMEDLSEENFMAFENISFKER